MATATATPNASRLECQYCGRKSSAPQGVRAHERFCEKNPKRLKQGYKRGSGMDAAIEALRALGGRATVSEVAAHLGKQRGGVNAALISAVRKNQLTNPKLGVYAIKQPRSHANGNSASSHAASGRPLPDTDGARILELIEQSTQPVAIADAFAALGIARSTGASAVQRLTNKGLIERVSQGVYRPGSGTPEPKPASRVNGNTHTARLLTYMREQGVPMRTVDSARAVGVAESTAYTIIANLARTGQVVRAGAPGLYVALPETNGSNATHALDATSRPSSRDLRQKITIDARLAAALDVLCPRGLGEVKNIQTLLEWTEITRELLSGS